MQNKILKEIEALGLVENFSDRRKKMNRDVIIVSPVGDKRQFLEFVSHVKKLGIEKKADFLFIVKKDLNLPKTTLSEVRCYEAIQIGTSGAFFIGQVIAYKLGYEIIVVADTDAYLDSQKTFDEMYKLCKKCQKVIVPKSIATEAGTDFKSYVLNQWSFFPRKMFETVGFSCPYFWYGGEDYELLHRCKKYGVIFFYDEGNVFHPVNGYTIFHKIIKKKYYLYIIGLLKSLLFISKYKILFYFKYIIWYCYYAFFADVFFLNELKNAIKKVYQFSLLKFHEEGEGIIKIETLRKRGSYSSLFLFKVCMIPFSIMSYFLFGYYDVYTDRIWLKGGRKKLFIGLLSGVLLLPVRFVECLCSIVKFRKNFTSVPYPPTVLNINKIVSFYEKILKKKE